MENLQPRWRSRIAWETTLAVLVLIAKRMFPQLEADAEWFNLLIDAVLGALATWGIFNNPKDKTHY